VVVLDRAGRSDFHAVKSVIAIAGCGLVHVLASPRSATWGLIPGRQDAYNAFSYPAIDGAVSGSDQAKKEPG
jgi:hypothetical protein